MENCITCEVLKSKQNISDNGIGGIEKKKKDEKDSDDNEENDEDEQKEREKEFKQKRAKVLMRKMMTMKDLVLKLIKS